MFFQGGRDCHFHPAPSYFPKAKFQVNVVMRLGGLPSFVQPLLLEWRLYFGFSVHENTESLSPLLKHMRQWFHARAGTLRRPQATALSPPSTQQLNNKKTPELKNWPRGRKYWYSYSMDESWKHCAKWKELVTKSPYFMFPFLWNVQNGDINRAVTSERVVIIRALLLWASTYHAAALLLTTSFTEVL